MSGPQCRKMKKGTSFQKGKKRPRGSQQPMKLFYFYGNMEKRANSRSTFSLGLPSFGTKKNKPALIGRHVGVIRKKEKQPTKSGKIKERKRHS